MTEVGAGGVVIKYIKVKKTFKHDLKKLPPEYRDRLEQKLTDLLANPRPPGLAFEKLKGYRKPDIYTIHLTGNYKISLEIQGNTAILRRVKVISEKYSPLAQGIR